MFQSEFLDALIDLPTSSRVTALEPFYCRRFFQCHEATLAHRKHDGLDHDVRRRAIARIVDLIPGLLERHAGLHQASLLPTRRHDETHDDDARKRSQIPKCSSINEYQLVPCTRQ